MLALFKNKKYSKEELHEELIKSWSEYYIKCYNYQNQKRVDYSINGKNINDALNELKEYGLGKSKNAKEIENLITQAKKIRELETSSRAEYEFIKTLKSYFPNAILIPYCDLFNILEKFDLSCGPIKIYDKLIPDENINEMIDVQKKLNNFNKINPNIDFCRNTGFRWMNEIRIKGSKGLRLSEVRNIINKLGRFPYSKFRQIGQRDIEFLEDILGISEFSSLQLNGLFDIKLEESDWVIIAPSKDLKDNIRVMLYASSKHKEKDLVDDPLACKITDFGLVSFTSWGEEANNSIFDKYKL